MRWMFPTFTFCGLLLLAGCLQAPAGAAPPGSPPNEQLERMASYLTWAALACAAAAVAFLVYGFFTQSLKIGLSGFLAGMTGFVLFGCLAAWLKWFLIAGVVLAVVGIVVGAIWAWKKGFFVDGQLAGAAKLLREGKTAEAVAVLRTRLPALEDAYRFIKKPTDPK